MARQKGSASFAGTLEVLAGGPLDARSQVPTKADLTVVSNFPYPYVGMQVYVIAEGKRYTLKAADVTVLANWEVEGGETDGGHTIEDPEGTALTQRDTLQFGGDLEVSDDDENEKTVVAPHELTTEELTEIMSTLPGQPTQGITIDLRGNEIVIGKVIESDGTEKTLYQKTITISDNVISTGNNEIAHNISNLGTIIHAFGEYTRANGDLGFCVNIPVNTNNFLYAVSLKGYTSSKILLETGSAYSGAGRITECHITLQYTKTIS